MRFLKNYKGYNVVNGLTIDYGIINVFTNGGKNALG